MDDGVPRDADDGGALPVAGDVDQHGRVGAEAGVEVGGGEVPFESLVGRPEAVPLVLSVAAEARTAGVAGVPARLSRLLSSLLDNAAKFSPPGRPVEITLTSAPDELVLTVRDHGPGISDEDLPYVFDRFYRARTARALPGSGLGLAMVRQIAHAHDAELTAEHAFGGGAQFRLRIPTRTFRS
ncbi:sensor histidine kinase [Streptomyces xanthii]|uniref:histidine kinase n=1 Tax=Streptomyces xanthii TaxID=2768069 RepID=A0A7H1BI19_9ACTN|nr:sensor histidine kinase [Streptomyces xanthii]